MDNLSFLLGLNAGNSGGGGSTPSWSDVTDKPFDTIGTGLTVTAGALEATGTASTPSWSDVTSKPFSTVGAGLEVSEGALKECVPLYHEEEQGGQYIETFSYTPEKNASGYSASVDTDWRYYNMYQDPTIDFRWKLEDDTEYRITSTFYFTNDDEVYEDDGGYHWKIKVAGNASLYLILECQDELPADAKTEAEAEVTVYIQDIVDIYHQLPAEYIQIDGSTIVNNSGYLAANIPAVPVVTATASTLTHGETIGSIEIDGVTTTFKGEYVPHKTSQLTNDADFLSASDTGITNTLSSGTAIGDLTIYGVTTTLYAPAGGGTAATPNWNATSGQDGYIDNKPDIKAGGGANSLRLCNANLVNGNYAIAIGNNCWASQDYSFAQGEGIQAMSSHQHIQGKYNIQNYQGTIFADIIGNGTSSARSNAEATDWSGNKYLAGDIYVGVTNWADPQNNATKLANIPAAPTTTAGTLTLQATVDGSGNVTYAWV